MFAISYLFLYSLVFILHIPLCVYIFRPLNVFVYLFTFIRYIGMNVKSKNCDETIFLDSF